MLSTASPGTNQFRCNACGRYFNTETELSTHETECRAAKMTTEAGRAELEEQDSRPHMPNDQESEAHPFQHGRQTND